VYFRKLVIGLADERLLCLRGAGRGSSHSGLVLPLVIRLLSGFRSLPQINLVLLHGSVLFALIISIVMSHNARY
jgi:hypothetical protein